MKKTRNTNNKSKNKKMAKSQKGITLVALVITIIVIIILAIVAINFALGDNGLIRTAEQARDFYANDTKYTEDSMSNVESYIDGIIPEEPFKPSPTPEPPTGGAEMEDMTNGVIEIKWLSGTSNNVSETPNTPAIKEDLPAGTTMELVRYTGEGSTEKERWVAGTEYSYEPGTGSSDNTSSKWANARVTKDGIDSYFVWIPRYAYRIIYFDSAESKKAYQEGTLTEEQAKAEGKIKGYSDSRGIVDAEGKKVANVTSTTKIMVSEDYFMTHPAFLADANVGGGFGNNNGTNDNGISGIWIGKYEASLANKEDGTNIVTDDEGTGNILLSDADHTNKTVVTRPGYSSWRYITIGNSYTNALAYSTDLQSHMLKNSEWGAVAYLTESKYGRNGTEIGMNRNSEYIIGGGVDNAYATTNQNQSTTGNVYGIYDMRGGTSERVAAYYNGSTSSNLTNNGGSFASNGGSSTKYATAYTGTSSNSAYKYGDATHETRRWHSNYANFVFSPSPFFTRGGYWWNGDAGVFYYDLNLGSASDAYYSFRLALVV